MTERNKQILYIGGGLLTIVILICVLSFPAAEYYRHTLGKERNFVTGYVLNSLHRLNQPVERLIFGFNRNPYATETYVTPKELRDKYRKLQPEVVQEEKSEKKSCWLKRKSESNEEYIVNSKNCNSHMVSWGGKLIFSEEEQQNGNPNILLVAYDFKTGEKRIIYDKTQHADDFEGAAPDLTSLQIINNKLYFSFGGYAATSTAYVLNNLNDSTAPQLIFRNRMSAQIEYRDGRYWISGGFGDAGYGDLFRMTFNPVTNVVGKEIRVKQTLEEGEIYLGADNNVAYIGKFELKDPEDKRIRRIIGVYTRNLVNPETTRVIFSEDTIYPGTETVVYDWKTKKIYLATQDVIESYDPVTHRYQEVVRLKPEGSYYIFKSRQDTLCASEVLEIDAVKNELVENREGCQNIHLKQKMHEVIQSVDIPSSEYEYNF